MANGHGGRRPGAGRPPGAVTQKARDMANQGICDGISPLEVMLIDMRQKFAAGHIHDAADRARDCAPYMHPRLQSVEQTGKNGGPIQQEVTVRQDLGNLSAAELETMQTLLEKASAHPAVH
jgi:hypothetical protein